MKKVAFCVLVMLVVVGIVPSFACTTAIISAEASGTGRPLLWKHRDTGESFNHIGYLKGEKYSFTALLNTRDTVFTAVWAGANEKGFVIANNVSYNINEKKSSVSARNGIVMMDALGVCATVDEFEEFIRTMAVPRHVRSNFAVIDAAGGAAYFEVGDDRYFRFDVKDSPRGYLYRTNFSIAGVEDGGSGYIRYEAAKKLFEDKGGNFTPGWIFDNLARSFYHGLMQQDLKDKTDRELGNGFIISQDYIPRPTSVSSVVFEGVNPGEDPNTLIMWSAIGYAPCSYAIPVWVGAESEIPTCLASKDGELAPANNLAMELKGCVFPITRGNGAKYLNYLKLRKDILPAVMKAEDKEIAEAEKLKRSFAKKGFSLEAIKQFNAEADRRFNMFCQKMKNIIDK